MDGIPVSCCIAMADVDAMGLLLLPVGLDFDAMVDINGGGEKRFVAVQVNGGSLGVGESSSARPLSEILSWRFRGGVDCMQTAIDR